jgi:hypothetical protein
MRDFTITDLDGNELVFGMESIQAAQGTRSAELELTSEEKVAFGALVSRIPAPETKIGPSAIQPVRWLVRTRAAAPDYLPDP